MIPLQKIVSTTQIREIGDFIEFNVEELGHGQLFGW